MFKNKKISPCKNEEALFNYALFLLSRKDYSLFKMTEKLKSRLPEDNSFGYEKTIAKLIDYKYLDDDKVAQRIFAKYGKKEQGFKLIMRFKKEGIEPEFYEKIINDEDNKLTIDDCVILLEKKFKTYNDEIKDKYFRFLASKNIDFDLIKKSINQFKSS